MGLIDGFEINKTQKTITVAQYEAQQKQIANIQMALASIALNTTTSVNTSSATSTTSTISGGRE